MNNCNLENRRRLGGVYYVKNGEICMKTSGELEKVDVLQLTTSETRLKLAQMRDYLGATSYSHLIEDLIFTFNEILETRGYEYILDTMKKNENNAYPKVEWQRRD